MLTIVFLIKNITVIKKKVPALNGHFSFIPISKIGSDATFNKWGRGDGKRKIELFENLFERENNNIFSNELQLLKASAIFNFAQSGFQYFELFGICAFRKTEGRKKKLRLNSRFFSASEF